MVMLDLKQINSNLQCWNFKRICSRYVWKNQSYNKNIFPNEEKKWKFQWIILEFNLQKVENT